MYSKIIGIFVLIAEKLGPVSHFFLAALGSFLAWQAYIAQTPFERYFFVAASVGCAWLVLEKLSSIFDIPVLNRFMSPDGGAAQEKRLIDAMLTAAAEVVYAGKTSFDDREKTVVIRCLRSVDAEQRLGDDEQIIDEFEQRSSTSWTDVTAKKVSPVDRLTLLSSAIEIASASGQINAEQKNAIQHIGYTLGFLDSGIEELIKLTNTKKSR